MPQVSMRLRWSKNGQKSQEKIAATGGISWPAVIVGTSLERAEHLARRKEIYETLHPEARDKVLQALSMHRKYGHNAAATVAVAFTEDAAQKTGLSPRTIRQDIQIATRILPEVRDALRNTELADSTRDLLRIARLEPELGHNVSTN